MITKLFACRETTIESMIRNETDHNVSSLSTNISNDSEFCQTSSNRKLLTFYVRTIRYTHQQQQQLGAIDI